MISRGDASSGGAGRIAEQLAVGLRRRGHQVIHVVRRTPAPRYRQDTTVLRGIPGDILVRNAIDVDVSGLRLLTRPEIWKTDLVHFHDFAVAFGSLSALAIAWQKPSVFTMHDFSGFSGGCLSPGACSRYQTGCGDCPSLGKWPLYLPVDLTRRHFQTHRRIAQLPHTRAVVPSKYLASAAASGAWKQQPVEVIANAIDQDVFHPRQRAHGRSRLGLTSDKTLLLFVAASVNDPLKGFSDCATAFAKLAANDSGLNLAIVGRSKELPPVLLQYQRRIHKLGLINDDSELASIYAAADCLVNPSEHETFSMTTLEAMSCGTPVMAYRSGALPEVLEHGVAGWLIDRCDAAGLEQTLAAHLDIIRQHRLREQTRRYAENNFSIQQFFNSHEALYEKLMSQAN